MCKEHTRRAQVRDTRMKTRADFTNTKYFLSGIHNYALPENISELNCSWSAQSPSIEILYGRFVSPYTYFIVEPTDQIYV